MIKQLPCCNELMNKVDLSDFYMHFLIGKAGRTYMRVGGQEVSVHPHALPPSSGSKTCPPR